MSGAGLAIVVVVMVLVVMAVAWICIVRARRTQRKSMIQRLLYYRDSYWGVQLEENNFLFRLDNGIAWDPNVYCMCMFH